VPVVGAVALAQILEAAELAGAALEQQTLQVIRARQTLEVAVEGVVAAQVLAATAALVWSSFAPLKQPHPPQDRQRSPQTAHLPSTHLLPAAR
jgi:hypothetical protein